MIPALSHLLWNHPVIAAIGKVPEEKMSPEQNGAVTASEDATTVESRTKAQVESDFRKSTSENSEKKPFTLQDYRRYVKSEVLPERCLEIRHLALDGTGLMLPQTGMDVYCSMDWVNDADLEKILSHFPNLETLDLGNQKNINDSGFGKIVTLAPNLRVLNTSYCHRISDAGLWFLKHLPLECLWLGRGKGKTKISDAGLRHVSEIRSLKEFTIIECNTITDVGVRDLCTLQLTGLGLVACHKLTDASIKSIAQIDTLKALDISGSPSSIPRNITEESIAKLENHPNLQQIVASSVPSIDEEAIVRLKARGIPVVNYSLKSMRYSDD